MGRRFEPDGAYKTTTPLVGVLFCTRRARTRSMGPRRQAKHRFAGRGGDRRGLHKQKDLHLLGVFLFIHPPGENSFDGPTPLMQRIALLVVAGTDGANQKGG